MLDKEIFSDEFIRKQYEKIKSYYEKYLRKFGIKLPSLIYGGYYSKNALVLIYLSINYPDTKVRSKAEITDYVRHFHPNTNDMQQARHLGAQAGWFIAAGGRDDMVCSLGRGYYKLHTLEKPYPGYKKERRGINITNWKEIKNYYGYRCATCGSKEGETNFHWPATKTKLQKGHKDPNKPPSADNIIPQCQKCNRADRERWVYDNKGRVIKLAKPSFVKNFDEEVQFKIYKILYKKYKGIDPYYEE